MCIMTINYTSIDYLRDTGFQIGVYIRSRRSWYPLSLGEGARPSESR